MNTIALIDTSVLPTIIGIAVTLAALILLFLTIMMPIYVYLIYRQGVKRAILEDTKLKIMTRATFAMESINIKMDPPPQQEIELPSIG
jgi:hypothetical protein